MSASSCNRLQYAKGVKRSTSKRHRKDAKNENIADVREQVALEDGACRITAALSWFGFTRRIHLSELAHVDARGMGGNPDLSRDTPENTLMADAGLHRLQVRSLHSGHLKVRPLTDKGTRGPCCFEFYEKLPTEIG